MKLPVVTPPGRGLVFMWEKRPEDDVLGLLPPEVALLVPRESERREQGCMPSERIREQRG